MSGRVLRVIPIVVLFIASSEMVFVLYGQWLEGNFGLSVAGTGTFSLLIAVGELSGEGAVVAFSDRSASGGCGSAVSWCPRWPTSASGSSARRW